MGKRNAARHFIGMNECAAINVEFSLTKSIGSAAADASRESIATLMEPAARASQHQ